LIIITEHCLIFWPLEGTYSVIPRSRLQEGNAIGDLCKLKIRRLFHEGTVIAIGMLLNE